MPGSDEVSVRDLEREINEMKREKSRTEDNIRRMEVSQRRVFGGERGGDHDQIIPADSPRKRPEPTGDSSKKGPDAEKAAEGEEGGEDGGKQKVLPPMAAREDGQEEKDTKSASPSRKRKSEDGENEATADSAKRRKKSEKGSDSEDDDEKSIPDEARNGKKSAEKAEEKKEEKEDKKDEHDRRDADHDEKRPKMERDSRPKAKEPAEKRSRNLFGGLLGHLKAAKKRLETEKELPSMELYQKAQQRIEQKLMANRNAFQDQKKQQMESQRKDEMAKAERLEKDIDAKMILLLQKRLEAHYSCMMNFTRTKAEPTIFYLPAKMDKNSDKLLEETRDAIKHKIASLQVQFQNPPEMDIGKPVEGEEAAARAAAAASAATAADAAADEANEEAREEARREEKEQLRNMKGPEEEGDKEDNNKDSPEKEEKDAKSDAGEEKKDETKDSVKECGSESEKEGGDKAKKTSPKKSSEAKADAASGSDGEGAKKKSKDGSGSESDGK